jgi:hypothetical protein
MVSFGQFHQRFYVQFFLYEPRFSSYVLALLKNSYKKGARITLMKLTTCYIVYISINQHSFTQMPLMWNAKSKKWYLASIYESIYQLQICKGKTNALSKYCVNKSKKNFCFDMNFITLIKQKISYHSLGYFSLFCFWTNFYVFIL